MNSATYPISVETGTAWQTFKFTVIEPAVDGKALSFLYIGQNEATGAFRNHFKGGDKTTSILQAQAFLGGLRRSFVPDVIFIDVQLNKAELIRFNTFLKERGFDSRTVLFYASSQLTAEEVRFLKRNHLIDDVVNIASTELNYTSKVSFLKKMKSRSSGLSVSNEVPVENTKKTAPKLHFIKRAIDILLASVAIILLSPLFLLIALAIKFESRGSIMYISPRAGKGFRVFKFYKFRTMEVGADKKIDQLAHLNQYADGQGGATFVKINNDPRVTRLGKVLRKTSLDEIPQLFNVVKGDMSLVGNRPLPLYEATTLTTNDCVERFMADAGITGLWQIKKRGKEDMSVEERISLDISYARKANVAYDLWIMAKTPTILFQKSNA
ncbi:MAG: sugar transferase [Chitinophagaceae bacterium]